MVGPPMSIELRPYAVPFAVRNPRPIPLAWRDQVRATLGDMQSKGIYRTSRRAHGLDTPTRCSVVTYFSSFQFLLENYVTSYSGYWIFTVELSENDRDDYKSLGL